MRPRKITHKHYGVYAFIQNDLGEVLVIIKTRGPYTGRYDLPGGSPEQGESPEETLIREVREETGREASQLSSPFDMEETFEYGQKECLLHSGKTYRCQVGEEIYPILTGEDSSSALWLSPKTFSTKNASPFLLKAITLFL